MISKHHSCSQMASKEFENIPQEVVTGNGNDVAEQWSLIQDSPQIKSLEEIGFYDHMMPRANQMAGGVMTQSSRKSIISQPADDGTAARNPLGKGKGTRFVCPCLSVFVCVRARLPSHLFVLVIPSQFQLFCGTFLHWLPGDRGWRGRRLLGCMKTVSPFSRTLFSDIDRLTMGDWLSMCTSQMAELHIGTICTWLCKPLLNTVIFW